MTKRHIASRALAAICLLASTAAHATPTALDAAADCELHWHFTPRWDTTPRRLDVRLSFPARGRDHSLLRLPQGWAGIQDFHAAVQGWEPAVTPEAERHRWRLGHPTNGSVVLHYQLRAALADPDDPTQPQPAEALYRVQLGRDWFQFFGYGALVFPEQWDDRTTPTMCVDFDGVPPHAPLLHSHAAGAGAQRLRLIGNPALLRHAFYAGGPGWRLLQRPLPGGPLWVGVRGQWTMSDDAFADATAALIRTHRRFWGDDQAPSQLVVLTPNHAKGNTGGTLVHQAAVMAASGDFQPGQPSFEFLVGHENLHQWLPQRIGATDPPPAEAGYWFSEGFTNYYTHRLLLRSGMWTLDRYADALTTRVRRYLTSDLRHLPNAEVAKRFFSDRQAGDQQYLRGEFLALRWDRALRAQGHPGLDTLMRGLLLPSGEASTTPATERLLAALQPLLGTLPRRDLQAHVERGREMGFDAELLGPCFEQVTELVPTWRLGFSTEALRTRRISGVEPDGPAWRAGLRDGQALAGYSIYHHDLSRPVELSLGEGKDLRTLSYLPHGPMRPLPRYRVRDRAGDDPACLSWQAR